MFRSIAICNYLFRCLYEFFQPHCLGFFLSVHLHTVSDDGSSSVNGHHTDGFISVVSSVLIVWSTTVTGLEQLIKLIISYLQVSTACLGDVSCIRFVKHVVTVLLVLYAQTQTEFGVTPDIVIYCTAWFLCGKNQMYTKASSYLSNTDQLSHEVRLFSLKFRKLIDDDKQMRYRSLCFIGFDQFGVGVDIVYTIIVKNLLSSAVFTLYGYHCTVDLVSGKVGDLSHHMWQA